MKKYTILILMTALIYAGCDRDKKNKTGENSDSMVDNIQATEVEGMVLQKGPFSKELSANGKVSAAVKVEVRTKLSEPVNQINVKNGQWVEKGYVIAVLDTFELYHNFIRQKIQFEKSRLDFADALVGLGYTISSLEDASKEQRHNAEMRSGIVLAETDFAIAKDKYLSAFIKAPVNGRIANLKLNEGNYSDNNGFICTIINNKQLYIDFYVLEEETSIISKGLAVEVSPFYNNMITEKGQITSINPTVENGLILVRAAIANENPSLYDGITVKVFVKSSSKHCLSVPKEAIVLRTGKKVIFTYCKNEKVAKWNYVKTGDENSTHVEITEGLKEMDTVIISGNLHLGNDVSCIISNLQ